MTEAGFIHRGRSWFVCVLRRISAARQETTADFSFNGLDCSVTSTADTLLLLMSKPVISASDAWEEGKHPRDADGRFGNGEKESSTQPKKGKVKRHRQVVQLPKEEFAAVQHAFMSDVTEEQRTTKRLEKYIGDFLYIGILREDGTRDIIGKEKINGID